MAGWVRRVMEAVALDATREVEGRSSVVLAPHPDDEVLGCGGTIVKKGRCGTPVAIVFLTDGRHGAGGSPEAVRVRRAAEAVRSASVLGVDQTRIAFLDFEDGRLREHEDHAAAQVRRTVAALDACDIFVPFRREYHGDHLATWRVGRAVLPRHGRLYEYPVWFGPWLWRRLGWRARAAAALHLVEVRHAVKIRIAEVLDVKREALAAYASQVAAFERQGPWGRAFLDEFLGDYELFFVQR